MEMWVLFWKSIFILTVSIYAVVALWVTVQGARDIKSMIADLRARHVEPPSER